MLRVHSIETFGTHEGPGIRLVVFLQGCNMRCLYCHNPDTQGLKKGKMMSVSAIINLLEKEKTYFGEKGGLTVSGGEPTLQAGELIKLFTEAGKRGFKTALDTNGIIYNPEVLFLYDLTDLLLLDIKHIRESEHIKLTGQSNKNPLKLALHREKSGKPMWIRYVLVPGYTDAVSDLEAFGRYFQGYSQIERVEILPYHTLGAYKYKELKLPYGLEKVEPPDEKGVKKATDILDEYFKRVITR